jgi:hypothetical protein
MIDAGEELADVHLKNEGVPSREALAALERPVCTLAEAVGEGIGRKGPVQDRLDEVAEGVVDHPVPEGRGADQPALGLVDEKAPEGTRLIAGRVELLLEGEEVFFEAVLEGGHVGSPALAGRGLLVRGEEILPGDQSLEHAGKAPRARG